MEHFKSGDMDCDFMLKKYNELKIDLDLVQESHKRQTQLNDTQYKQIELLKRQREFWIEELRFETPEGEIERLIEEKEPK